MRTTVDLPDGLARQARALAHRQGTTLRDLVIQGLRKIVDERSRRAETYRLADRSCGEGGLVADLAQGDWGEILERVYKGRGA